MSLPQKDVKTRSVVHSLDDEVGIDPMLLCVVVLALHHGMRLGVVIRPRCARAGTAGPLSARGRPRKTYVLGGVLVDTKVTWKAPRYWLPCR